jgi:adenylate cyclase
MMFSENRPLGSDERPWMAEPAGIPIRRLRLASGIVLFIYIFAHLLNHALGLISLNLAERALAIAKDVWYSVPGTLLLYGAAAVHVFLALRTVYTRQHWHLPLIEYVRLGAGFSLPLLLIGHVVTTRLAFAMDIGNPRYASVVQTLMSSGNEGWQLALLAPGWVHGCLGLWLTLVRYESIRKFRWGFIFIMALVPCLAAAGFLSMRAEVAIQMVAQIGAVGISHDLGFWRRLLTFAYLCVVGCALLAGPIRRAVRK